MSEMLATVRDTSHPLATFGVVMENYDPDQRASDLAHGVAGRSGSGADIVACLPTLLAVLNWQGSSRDLAEALPHKDDVVDITSVRNVLARLGFVSQILSAPKALKNAHNLPGVLLPRKAPAMVVLAVAGKIASVYDSRTGTVVERPLRKLRGQFISCREEPDSPSPTQANWYKTYFQRYSGLTTQTVLLTGLSNLLALAVPLFVLLTYDRFIPTGSTLTWVSLVSGVGLALLADLLVRKIRRRIISFMSTRLGYLASVSVTGRLLGLPLSMTEKASVGAQVARIRDLERVKEFVGGPLGAALLDLPFMIIFIGAIAAIAGWLALLPLVAGLFFVICGIAFSRTVAASTERAAKVNAQRQEITIEIIQNLRAIKAAGNTEAWIDRYDRISQNCVQQNFKSARIATVITTLSQSLTLISGLATLGFGTFLAIDGTITTGALIATMFLFWRAIAPMQSVLLFLTRIDQLRKSIDQTDRLLNFPPEKTGGLPMSTAKGRVKFNQVTFRYPGELAPAVSNLSLEVKPGEVVAIVGKNGSGKSSVLKLIAGLYEPLAGRVLIDDRDIRQIDPKNLRQLVSYVSQSPHFFNGTILENLTMSHPLANEKSIIEALETAGAWEEIEKLPEQLNTFIQARQSGQLSTSLLMRLSLARAYLRKSPIVLLDEPITGLDFESEFFFTAAIDQIRANSTVFIVTHRPSHLRMSDKVLILEDGMSRYYGDADKIRDQIPSHLL